MLEFNELSQGYPKLDNPKLVPTYTEVIAASSLKSLTVPKYTQNIFPSRFCIEQEIKEFKTETIGDEVENHSQIISNQDLL